MTLLAKATQNISTKASVELKMWKFNPVNLSVSVVFSQTKFISGGSEGGRVCWEY